MNDFRKIAGFEAYAPTDNVCELTARVNDESWEDVFVNWLKGSRLRAEDMVFVFSVGGGNLEKNISPNLVRAVQYAKEVGAAVLRHRRPRRRLHRQGRRRVLIVPTVNPDNDHAARGELPGHVWHLLVSHPAIKAAQTKWESAVTFLP